MILKEFSSFVMYKADYNLSLYFQLLQASNQIAHVASIKWYVESSIQWPR